MQELTDSDGSSETSTEESGIGHTPSSGEEDKYTQHDTSQGNDNKVKKRVKKKENVKLKSKKSEDSAGSSVGSTGSTGNTGNTGNHNIVLERGMLALYHQLLLHLLIISQLADTL